MLTSAEKREIERLLIRGFKIFLDKDCKQEHIRHSFYYNETNELSLFYHVRVSYSTGKEIPSVKDYPTRSFKKIDTSTYLEGYLNDILKEISDYMDSGYTISCNKEE